MYRDRDEIYNRGMGYPVDERVLQFELQNGMAGYSGDFDRSNGFELDASDLYVESNEIYDPRQGRLQDIEFELAALFQEQVPSDETLEAVLLLEVEKTMLTEEIAMEVVAKNPRDTIKLIANLHKDHSERAQALQDYLVTNLIERGERGEPIDTEMLAEAAELSASIAEANPDETPEGLVRIAYAMHEAIMARCELERVLSAA